MKHNYSHQIAPRSVHFISVESIFGGGDVSLLLRPVRRLPTNLRVNIDGHSSLSNVPKGGGGT